MDILVVLPSTNNILVSEFIVHKAEVTQAALGLPWVSRPWTDRHRRTDGPKDRINLP